MKDTPNETPIYTRIFTRVTSFMPLYVVSIALLISYEVYLTVNKFLEINKYLVELEYFRILPLAVMYLFVFRSICHDDSEIKYTKKQAHIVMFSLMTYMGFYILLQPFQMTEKALDALIAHGFQWFILPAIGGALLVLLCIGIKKLFKGLNPKN